MSIRRILLLFCAFLVTLLVGTWLVLDHAGASHRLVREALGRFLRVDFGFTASSLDLASGSLRIDGLRVADPRRPGRDLLSAEAIELRIDTNPLDAIGTLREVVVQGLVLDLGLSTAHGIDLAEILVFDELQPGGATGATAEPAPPPAIRVRDALVLVEIVEGAEPLRFRDLDLDLLPAEDGEGSMLTGAMTSNLGKRLRIDGRGSLEPLAFQCLVDAQDVPLDAGAARCFGPRIADIVAGTGVRGRAESLKVWLRYPADTGGAGDDLFDVYGVEARMTAQLADLRGTVPELPYPFRDGRIELRADLVDGGHVVARVDAKAGSDARLGGDIELRRLLSDEPELFARLRTDDVPIDDVLGGVLERLDPAAQVWRAFGPRGGRAACDLQLRGPLDRPRATFDLALDGCSVSFEGFAPPGATPAVAFPYRIDDLRGTVQVREGRVVVRDVVGTAEGGELRLDADLGFAGGSVDSLDMQAAATDLPFSDRLRSAFDRLIEGGAGLVDTYSPRGRTDLDVRLSRPGRDADLGYRVTLRPRGASASYAGFPYRVGEVAGSVVIASDGIRIDLEGTRADTPVRVVGRFAEDPAGSSGGLDSELWVEADRVVLDERLREALLVLGEPTPTGSENAFARLWEYLTPSGIADLELSLWRDSADVDFRYDIRCDIGGAQIVLEGFDIPFTELGGSVFVHGTGDRGTVDVADVEGRIASTGEAPPARLWVQGSVRYAPEGQRMDLGAIVRGLQLNDRLADALDRKGAFNRATWDALRPSGFVDVISRHTRKPGDADVAMDMRVQLRDVSSAARMLPGIARRMNGEVRVRDGRATFSDIHGVMKGVPFTCHEGSASHAGGSSKVRFVTSADGFPVDDDLANLLSGPLEKAYLDRAFSGTVNIKSLEITFDIPREEPVATSAPGGGDAGSGLPPGFVTTFSGQFSLRNLEMTLAIPVREVTGLCTVREAHVDATGGRVVGDLADVSFNAYGHRAHSFRARFTSDPDEVVFEDLQARIHNGVVEDLDPSNSLYTGSSSGRRPVAVRYRYAGEGALQAALQWDGISLRELLQASDRGDLFYSGTLSGVAVLLDLQGADFIDANAITNLRLRHGDLGEVPMFSAIYGYLSPNRRPRFQSLDVAMRLAGRRIHVEPLKLSSPLVEVEGRGTVHLDGYLDMVLQFPDLFAASEDWMVLPGIFHFLTRSVVSFQVYGYLRNPRARPRFLWERGPGRVPLTPIPPMSPVERERSRRREGGT